MLTVNEIFHSIQGESTHAGRLCVFVRLTACDLRCSWCDTAYAFHEGAKMAVKIDAEALTPEQRDALRKFTASGNTLLTGPPEFHDKAPPGASITLDKAELERLNDVWRDVQNMVGRRNLGVRLFNVWRSSISAVRSFPSSEALPKSWASTARTPLSSRYGTRWNTSAPGGRIMKPTWANRQAVRGTNWNARW